VRPKRPINADVPAPEESKAPAPDDGPQEPAPKPAKESAAENPQPAKEKPPKPAPKPKEAPAKTRQSKSLTPVLLGGLVLLALAFIVIAIVGGSGGGKQESTSAAPAPAGAGAQAPAAQTAEALGYPSFATNNTTRIGGSDPAANAAGAALAVFPSTTPAQRPAAVTLVGEEDWAGAIAAAVLMAPPVRAPLLFSGPDELPEASAEALSALDPQGSKETGGSSLFAIGAVAAPGEATSHVDSGDAASTAAQIATLRDRLFGGPPKHFVVVSSAQPGFAAPAAAWAARSGDPVLFTEASRLPQQTAAILEQHRKVPVYVLGPTAAISDGVVREIAKVDKRVKRVGGKDPVANAIAFARFHDGSFGWNVNDPGHGFVLARSDSPLDAAAAAPLSASGTWGPLLLTDDAGALPAAARSYFLDVKPGYTTDPTRAFYNHVWVIGDQDAIGVGQQAEVNELAELAKIGGGE
jgi:ell wall binding domain 2 (CWB2)